MSCLEPDEPFSRVVQQFLGIHLNVVLTDRHVTVGEHLIHALILEEKPFTERLGGVFRGCTLERKAAWGPETPEGLYHPGSCLQIKPSFPLPWTLDTFKPGYHPSSPMCCEDLHIRSKDL